MMKFSLKNLNLLTKLLIYIIATSSIIFSVAIAIIAVNFNSIIVTESEKAADSYSKQYANQMQAKLNRHYGIIKGLTFAVQANSFTGVDYKPLYAKALIHAVEKTPDFVGCFASLEISDYGQNWNKPYGRFKYSAIRSGNSVVLKIDSVNLTGDVPGSGYATVKQGNRNFIKDPYFDTYTGNEKDKILMTSIGCVLQNKGKFAGLVEADIPLDWFQKVVSEIKPFKNSYAFLLSYNGSFVAHPKRENLGKSITEVQPDYVKNFQFIEKTKKGEAFSFSTIDSVTNQTVYVTVSPVIIDDINTPWSLAIVVPTNVIREKAYENLWLLLLIGIIGLIFLSLTVWFIARSISKPIVHTTKILNQIAKGEILDIEKIEIKSNDEIAQMGKSLNTLIDGLNNTANFANEIGKGNLKIKFEALSKNDVLGNALLNMQQNLIKLKEEEDQRKIEDEKRNWATHGLAKFGELLRSEYENMTELAFSIIQNLVQYLNANQGGLFVLNDEDKNEKYLELLACYAYDRRKFLEKKIMIGEGLVGTCFQEQETIYLTELPEKYITISSGLGESRPRALLIVPLKINDEIFGVIELASFKEFQPYEIEFVEKVGESIASTIKSVQINTRTAYLLQQSQEQSEEMRAQEEEMRQNMEELTATQETLAEKERLQKREIDNLLSQLSDATENLRKQESQFIQLFENLIAPSFICNTDGIIEKANFAMLQLLNINANQVIGKTIISFISGEYIYQFQQLLNQLSATKNQNTISTQETVIKTANDFIKAHTSINLITINNQNKFFISFNEKHQKDSSEKIKQLNEKLLQTFQQVENLQKELHSKEQALAGKLAAINQFMFYAEFDIESHFIKINNLFASNLGYDIEEIIGKTHQLLVDEITAKTLEYQFFWNELRGGLPQTGEYKLQRKDGSEILIYGTYSPVFNNEGKTEKILLLAEDITIEKQQDNDLQMLLHSAQKSYIYAELNNDWQITMVNDAFGNSLGTSKTEILKTNFKQYLHHQFLNSEIYKDTLQEIKLGKNASLTMQLLHTDGSIITWHTMISPLTNAFGIINRILIIAYDITELQHLKQKAEQFEKMAEEKTEAIKLIEDQLLTSTESEKITVSATIADNETILTYQKEINELTMLLQQVLDEAEKKYNINFNNLHNQ